MKKTTKLLSIILALIMCLGILPLSASAETTIDTVAVTGVTPPVVGATASFDWSIPSNQGYIKSVGYDEAWVETSTIPKSFGEISKCYWNFKSDGEFTFKSDKYYTFVTTVAPDTGCQFSDDVTPTVNGNKAKFVWLGDEITLWYCFVKPSSSTTTIKSVTVTGVTPPVAGATASFDWSIPSNQGYCKKFGGLKNDVAGCWVETSTMPTSIDDLVNSNGYVDSFTFNPDKYYTFVAWIDWEWGYQFSSKTSATINNMPAQFIVDQPYYDVLYFFGKPASSATEILTGIEVTSAPSNTELQYKSTASTDGLKVTAKYSNGTTKDVTDKVNVKNFSADNKRGDYTATVEFEGKTSTFNYTVKYVWWQWIIKVVLFGWIWY